MIGGINMRYDCLDKTRLRLNLKQKKDKTMLEDLYLKYYKILSMVSEACIDVDKQHTTPQKAIKDIQKYLGEM